jgi:hypothetical protein
MSVRLDLTRLGQTLRQRYGAARPALVVQVANAGRSLSVVPSARASAARAEPGLQTSTRGVPHGKGFELYVSIENPPAAAASARMAPPAQADARLILEEGRRLQMWTLPGPAGDRIVVRLQLGEDMTEEEAGRLLQIVGKAIAP